MRRANAAASPHLLGARDSSRSPPPVTPPRPFARPVPEDESPQSPTWRPGIPGAGADKEEMRWYMISEFGRMTAEAHAHAQRTYEARLEIDAIKRTLNEKADISAVQAKLASDSGVVEAQLGMLNEGMNDLVKKLDLKANAAAVQTKFIEDNALFDAKLQSMNEAIAEFEVQVGKSFYSVNAVEASFKEHVAGNFAETVAAMQWLEASLDGRFAVATEHMRKNDANIRTFLTEIDSKIEANIILVGIECWCYYDQSHGVVMNL